jgi:hypothetical protein
MKPEKRLQIRNSTAEFLIFTRQAGEDGIEVRVAEETVWLTQKLIGVLFDVTVPTVNEHLANLYAQGEISRAATIRNFRTVQKEGSREVSREMEFYNLDAIIAVGFRVNSARAILFRQWATGLLRIAIAEEHAIPTKFLPQRNARIAEMRIYGVFSSHCNISESFIFAKILLRMARGNSTQRRKGAKAQRVSCVFASLRLCVEKSSLSVNLKSVVQFLWLRLVALRSMRSLAAKWSLVVALPRCDCAIRRQVRL